MIICQKCKKEYEKQPGKPCECRGRSFVRGDLKIHDDKTFTCECGSVELSFTGHVDGPKTYGNYGNCTGCGKAISIFGFRDPNSLMYDDEEN